MAEAKTVELKISTQGHPPARLDLPKNFESRKDWPLVINIHGYKGSIGLQRLLTRMDRHQNALGFVLLTPQSTTDKDGNTFWNGSNYCCDFYKSGVDDKAYIRQLIEHIASHPVYGRINLRRVYLFGHSNGAFLSYSLACEMPDLIAGVAGYAGTMDLRDENAQLIPPGPPCSHNIPMPIYHIHGTNDRTIKFEGHDAFPQYPTGYQSSNQLVSNWLEHNECSTLNSDQKRVNATLLKRGKETTTIDYKSCESGSAVRYSIVQESGHVTLFRKSFYRSMLEFLLSHQR